MLWERASPRTIEHRLYQPKSRFVRGIRDRRLGAAVRLDRIDRSFQEREPDHPTLARSAPAPKGLRRARARHGIRTGDSFQMSRAYSAMVRSEENFPERAVFRIAIRAQRSLSRNA